MEENFETWLSKVSSTYQMLRPVQQVETIVELMKMSCPEQRFFLEREISQFLHQDILVALPRELQEVICDYIDVKSLFTACCVSKEWNGIISSLTSVWKSKGNSLGIGLLEREEIDWKQECLNALRVIAGMRSGSAFQHREFTATGLTLDHVTGLHYSDGLLVGSAEDQVGFWRTTDYELVAIFSVPYRVSCLRLNRSTLILGHTNGCTTAWCVRTNGINSAASNDWCRADMTKEFRGHTGVVMSVSACTKLDLLVSGSTDFTAKLWSIKSGALIKTLVGQTHWIIQVSLFPYSNKSCSEERGENRLITKTRDSIHLYSWPKKSSTKEGMSIANIASLEGSKKVVSLHPVGNFVTSGCHIVGKSLVFVRQTWTQGHNGQAEIVFHDTERLECTKKIGLKLKIRKLLAVGKVFALILQPWVKHQHFNLTVINITNGEIVGGCYVPHSSSATPDLAQITIGNVSWCDGLTFLRPDEIVVGLGLPFGVIHIVTWQDLRLHSE
ncbi:F-box/WD repeat-containing protein 2-like [Ischnura elegans]|uniref:F-box/WD repeat-containing protein 2-like n=1 Tax=Ischnura elegans TaxID=197161 RepID=UPI001ED8B626|nr:F-box/WD repeat-containing protein 2-like [Ischnura elegans]XP_046401152.1 F-box/WD repeat-containing protein 2-like [Ischnura elegans]